MSDEQSGHGEVGRGRGLEHCGHGLVFCEVEAAWVDCNRCREGHTTSRCVRCSEARREMGRLADATLFRLRMIAIV